MKTPATILAIDDQTANLVALEAALSDGDYKLVTASSGTDGIVKLLEREFAAILLDVQMPIMDGFETARVIRSRGIDTPIIFLTAIHDSESYAIRGYEAGAVDYLFKPLNVDILRAKIAVFVDLFRKKKEIERQSILLSESADRKYRDLVEGIRNGIVWTSLVGSQRFSYVSASASEISGYPISQWFSEKHFLICHSHAEDQETIATALTHLLSTTEDVDFEHRLIRPDQSVMWLHTTIRLAETNNGREYRGLSVDITKLKESEQSLRDSLSVRDEFLSIASHELKTPLTPLQLQISGFQRLLKKNELRRLPPETINRMLDVSASQVDILGRLVDQLLNVSRIKSGILNLALETVDLVKLVNKVVDVFQNELVHNKVPIDVDLPEQVVGQWDAIRLEQVLVNLLDNALKYGLGRPIQISLKKQESYAQLEVRDHGIGIPPEAHERIFNRFERAVSTSNYSGMGLGLYISQQIMDLHKGSITVQSRPNAGSSFTLHLPL